MLHLFQLLGNKQGDVYYVESESAGYVWINDNGTLRWELLGMTVDTSNFLTKTGLLQTTGNVTNNTMSQNAITSELSNKQDTLVSGTNIKTINNTSLLGSGNIDIQGGDTGWVNVTVVSGTWEIAQIRKIGKQVFFIAQATNVSTATGIKFRIPEQFRIPSYLPALQFYGAEGFGNASNSISRWYVNSSGEIGEDWCLRIDNGSQKNSNTWQAIHATWLID
jgi:hypothetical protein